MRIQIDDKDFDLMLEYDQIKKRIRLIGIQLNVDFENRIPVFVGVLNGSFVFLGDLIKEITIASEVTFVKVKSYNGDKSSVITDEMDISMDLKDRDVIVVEDIVDTGKTLKYILEKIKAHNPASVNVCSLLFKPNAMEEEIEELTYVGFEISNDFVVGYGLDYNGLGRNFKDVYKAVSPAK